MRRPAGQSYLDQALAWQRALDRDYAERGNGNVLSHRRRRRGSRYPPRRNDRRGDAEPQRGRSAKSHPAWRSWPATTDGAQKADRLIAAIAPLAFENLYMHMALFNAIDLRLRAAEIVVTGEGAGADALLAAARRLSPLDRIVLHARSADALPPAHPARAQIQAAKGEAQAFVCVGETCSLPVDRPCRPSSHHRGRATKLTQRSIRRRFVLSAKQPGRQRREIE